MPTGKRTLNSGTSIRNPKAFSRPTMFSAAQLKYLKKNRIPKLMTRDITSNDFFLSLYFSIPNAAKYVTAVLDNKSST